MRHPKSETYITNINKLDKKGSGHTHVWRDIGNENPRKLKITIPQTLPEEKVKVTVPNPDKRRTTVMAEKIIEPHPERTEPPCPHFERCGGCVWQHWEYNGQLKEKANFMKRELEKNGFDPNLVKDAIGMDHPWNYRNKMEFTFTSDGSLGLHEIGNYQKIIPLKTCLIAGEEMVDALKEIEDWGKNHQLSGYVKDTKQGLLRHLLVRQSSATGEMMLGVVATESPEGPLENAVNDLTERIISKFPQVKSLLWLKNEDWADRVYAEATHLLAGRDFIYDEMYGYRYRLWYDTFFQTNPLQAEKLVELAIKMGEPKETDTMLDLYCGVGTFSLPFASRVKKLAGIEIVESSIASAKRNARDNGLTNTSFTAKDVRRGMDNVMKDLGVPDLLLLDPPRDGTGGKVMRRIGRAQPERIVYVSCNPISFASDIKELVPYGYELIQVQPVDLFPHTVHVESVALLQRTT